MRPAESFPEPPPPCFHSHGVAAKSGRYMEASPHSRSPVRSNPLHPYAAAVLVTARRRGLFSRHDRVLVALSAGPDSTALLASLAALREAGELAGLTALHVDHGLRPGVEADAACAAVSCARLGVALQRTAVHVAPGNVQAEARRARYAALRAEAARTGATRIATGHTRTDQAETLLLRLIRGAGSRGLAGIPPRRGLLIRPLIDRAREEGLAYLAELDLPWREDPTNASPRFARNRIRHEAWPSLRDLAPSAERALARAADLLRDDDRALTARARRSVREATSVDVTALGREPVAVRRRVVRRLWRNSTGSGRGLEAGHVEAVLALLGRGRPGASALPGGRVARCRYGRLEILRPPAPAPAVRAVPVAGPGRYEIPELGALAEIQAGQPEAIPWPLELRTRRPGDRLRPDGGSGSTTLKEWLIDRKVGREERGRLLLLASPDGTVLAVPALRVVAQGLGPSGAALEVRISTVRSGGSSYCNGGAGLL
jgi:tRNA(Ile)-lysidine synthase